MAGGPVWVAGLGAVTSVGRDAWSSAAAVRAGISGFAEHPFMIDTAGEPMRVALAPWLDIDLQGQPRYEALLFPAVEQALAPVDPAATPQTRVALALAVPSPRPGLPPEIEAGLRQRADDRFSGRFVGIGTFPVGHAGGFIAMQMACTKILEDAFDACVIAGVESYLAPETLEWLEANEQVHGAGPLNNAWGFIPGEAAGAILIVSSDVLSRVRAEPFVQVLGVGTAVERNRIKTETVCIGEGLTEAFRSALAGLPPGDKVTDVFCDMNGEPYRSDEFGFAVMRTKDSFVAASDFTAPADCWGDVSAASAPLGAILAAIASRKAYANGACALVWGSSESGERGAALFGLPAAGGL